MMPGALDILSFLGQAGIGIGDTISQFGANAANDQRYNEALGLNASQGQWGHNQLDRNNAMNNLAYQNLLGGANNYFFGGGGPSQPGLQNPYGSPTGVTRADRRNGGTRYGKGAPIETAGGGGVSAGPGGGQLGQGGLVGQINQGYSDLRNRALSDYEGFGNMQRKDLNRSYDRQLSSARGDATRRGMASSTIMGGMNRGIERERADSVGRLDERLQMGRIGLDTSLSGQMLGNQWNTGMGAFGATNNAALNAINAQDAGNMRTFDFGNQNLTNRGNIIGSRNDVYQPSPYGISQNLGSGMAPAPQYPTDNSGLYSGIFGAANTGIGLGLLGAFG